MGTITISFSLIQENDKHVVLMEAHDKEPRRFEFDTLPEAEDAMERAFVRASEMQATGEISNLREFQELL